MSRGAPGLPKAEIHTISKAAIFSEILEIDNSERLRKIVLNLESSFREHSKSHISSLPTEDPPVSGDMSLHLI